MLPHSQHMLVVIKVEFITKVIKDFLLTLIFCLGRYTLFTSTNSWLGNNLDSLCSVVLTTPPLSPTILTVVAL
uniref:Uncharacterized protein n=1 Tax=Ciona intestinalis TaxID=7719 RepID=H2XMW8_CIOIN